MTHESSRINPNNALMNYHAQFKVFAVDPITKAFLHMSGSGETYVRAYAWVGTRRQFSNLRKALDKSYDLVSIMRRDEMARS